MTSGVVIIDKPAGRTSRSVVEEVGRALGVKKAGHTGTLDPLATGVLPVCINEATKLVQFLTLDTKDYRATLLLGVRTDTLDTEGKILSREAPRVTRKQAERALQGLAGKRTQSPPLYSAVKFRGKPLYDWTRRGIEVERLPREVEVFSIRLLAFRLPEVDFAVSCSKGTYVRSLAAEAGEALGCGGCLSALRRTRSGMFHEGMALAIEGMTREEQRARLASHLLPPADVLPGIAAIDVEAPLAERLRKGYQPEGEVLLRHDIPFLAAGDVIKFTQDGRRLVALARMRCASDELATDKGRRQAVSILRVFNE